MWPNPLSVPFSLLSRISYVTLQITFLSRGIKPCIVKACFSVSRLGSGLEMRRSMKASLGLLAAPVATCVARCGEGFR